MFSVRLIATYKHIVLDFGANECTLRLWLIHHSNCLILFIMVRLIGQHILAHSHRVRIGHLYSCYVVSSRLATRLRSLGINPVRLCCKSYCLLPVILIMTCKAELVLGFFSLA